MAAYTPLNQQQMQALADQYGLVVTAFEPLNGGNGNSSYIMQTQQARYVLTVCDDKTFDQVFKMGRLLLLLQTHHVPCNRLIRPLNAEILITHADENGVKAVMLKDYIPGQVVEQPDEAMLVGVGQQAARLNQIPAPDYLPIYHPYGRQRFPTVVGLNIDAQYERWMAAQVTDLEQQISAELPRGLIHGDLFYDNMLFAPGGAFKAFIDFEEACHYHLIFELAMAILGCCVEDNRVNLAKARALVEGYQQVRPLQPIEKASLQLFVRYTAVATSYWRFNQYNIEKPNSDKATDHWQMVQIANGVDEIPGNEFYAAVFTKLNN